MSRVLKCMDGHAEERKRTICCHTSHIISIFVFLLGALSSGLIAVYMGKDLNGDLFNYHFYNGWAAWTGHTWSNYVPAQLQSFFNPALDIAQYLAIAQLPPIWVCFLIGAVQGVSCWLLFAIASEIFVFKSAWVHVLFSLICAIAGLSGPMAVSEFGCTMGDFTLSVPVLAGVVLVVWALAAKHRDKAACYLGTAGICLGAATGLKYTMAIFLIAAIAATLATPPRSCSRTLSFISLVLGGAIGLLLTAGPWMLTLYKRYGSPLFPFFNNIFHSPYAIATNWYDGRWVLHSLSAAFWLPFLFVHKGIHHMEIPFRTIRFALAWSAIFLIVVFEAISSVGRRQARWNTFTVRLSTEETWFLWFFIVGWLVWMEKFGYYRYLAPLELLAPMVVMIAVRSVFPWDTLRLAVFALIMTAMVTSMSVGSWGRGTWKDPNYFDVHIPASRLNRNTMVIMTSNRPLAYVVPFFAHEVQVVRIQSNFDSLQTNQWRKQLVKVIGAHKGSFALLTVPSSVRYSDPLLQMYGLTLAPGTCQPLSNNRHYEYCGIEAVLCKVYRCKRK